MSDKTKDIISRILSGSSIEKKSNIKPLIYIDHSGSSIASGTLQTKKSIERWLSENRIEAEIRKTGSMGAFSLNPLIGIKLPGRPLLFFGPVNDYQVDTLLEAVFSLQIPRDLLIGQWPKDNKNPWEGLPFLDDHNLFIHQERRVMALHGILDPDSLEDYLEWDGYRGFIHSLRNKEPKDLLATISECKVRGRSGSGFLLTRKWEIAMNSLGKDIYLVCNADESDPGGFMHRVLLEGNPHLVFEGIMISAYVIGCSKAIIYTRNRYHEAVERLENALRQIKEAGLLGKDILDSGYSLDIEIRKGPGAFICGEETALIASIEGLRGMPKPKPPFPAEKGLHGQPTIVHNVETIVQIPLIISHGKEWYNSAGTPTSRGTKLLSMSGRFANQGVVEVALGTSLETIVNEIGGPPLNRKPAKALLMGGPSGQFIHPDEFSAKLDYDELKSLNLLMGSGSMVLLDSSNCVVEMTEYLMTFIRQESCGKCIPCREGTKRMADIINLITHPESKLEEDDAFDREEGVSQLKDLAKVIAETSLCGLGKNAPGPLISSMEKYQDDWNRHIYDRVCDAGVCRDLRTFYIEPDRCTGCFLCLNKCPEMAIVGSPRQVHVIIEEKCTGCGICQEVCKFNAVETR